MHYKHPDIHFILQGVCVHRDNAPEGHWQVTMCQPSHAQCVAWCQVKISGVWGRQQHSEPHTTPVPHQYLPSCPSLSTPSASVSPSWQVCFYLCKAFLRHSSPSCLLDDLEELQWVAHIPSRRKGKDKVCFQNENFKVFFFFENSVRFDLCIPRIMEVDLLCKRGFSFKLIIKRIHLNICQYKSDSRCSGILFVLILKQNFKHFPPHIYWGHWKKLPINC